MQLAASGKQDLTVRPCGKRQAAFSDKVLPPRSPRPFVWDHWHPGSRFMPQLAVRRVATRVVLLRRWEVPTETGVREGTAMVGGVLGQVIAAGCIPLWRPRCLSGGLHSTQPCRAGAVACSGWFPIAAPWELVGLVATNPAL